MINIVLDLILCIMAVVKYGSLVTEVKGAIGGIVFQKMGKALGVRSNPSHKSASTNPALSSRVQFAQIVSAWRSLSNAQKAAWSASALTYPAFDAFGQPFDLTGYQLFIKNNRYLQLIGAPLVSTASDYSPPIDISLEDDGLYLGTSTCIVSWSGTIPANHQLLFFITNPLPPSTSYRNAKYHYAFSIPSPGTSGANRFSSINPSFRTTPYANAMWGRYGILINKSTGCWLVTGGIYGLINA